MWNASIGLIALLLTTALARGEVRTSTLDYTVDGRQYQGVYAYDDATTGKRPGVLVFPEWWGVTDYAKMRARMLAALGYPALAVDVYGDGKTVDDPEVAGKLSGELKKDPAKLASISSAALAALRRQPQVDGQKLAAIGYCFGGYAALELARAGAPLEAVVTFHGDLGTHNPDGDKNVKARVLVLNGGIDPYVTAEDLERFKQRMSDAGVDWQIVTYGGAMHSFTNPDADRHQLKGIAYNQSADRRSWQAMQSFFADIFGPRIDGQ